MNDDHTTNAAPEEASGKPHSPLSDQQLELLHQTLGLAEQHFMAGDLGNAEQKCRRALDMEPNQPVALHMLGMIAHQQGHTDGAVMQISRAIEAWPDYAEAHLNLGAILQMDGRLLDAVGHFRRVVDINPNIIDGFKNLGMALYHLGYTDDALHVLEAGLERDPGNTRLTEILDAIPRGQGIPFAKIRVEATNACAYACHMCPREKMSRKTGIMPTEDYQFFLERFQEYVEETNLPDPYKGLFFMHGFGESLMDPRLAEKSAMVAEHFPASESLIISTLGVRRPEAYFTELLTDGKLKHIIVSLYGFQQKTYSKVQQGGHYPTVRKNLIHLAELNAKLGYPCEITVQLLDPQSLDAMKADPAEQDAFDDLMAILEPLRVKIAELRLHNFGGGRDYFDPQGNKAICSVVNGVRHKHLNVTWDLKIVPCCFDYNAEIVLGDLRKQSIAEIYSSEEYNKFIDAHRHGNLDDYPVCKGCDQR